MGKNKRVAAKQPKSMQEQLIALPKFADGGKVDPVEELLKRSQQKYGTGPAPTPEPPKPVAQPAPEQRGLVASLPGKIQQRNDDLKRVMDYDKRPGMAAGGIAGIDKPISLQDTSGTRAPLPTFGAGAIGNSPMTAPVQNQIGGLDYGIAGPKQTGFLWSDGTRRDGLTPEQAQRQDAQQIAAPVAPATAPLLTMAEKQIAQGINPNATYRPGGPGDPHASGGMAATAAQTASLAAAQPALPVPPIAQPIVNPMDAAQRRGQRRTAAYADGGRVIPVNIGQGLYQAIAQPIIEDWKQGNVAIKNVRDQYPTVDNLAGIHPAVAAAQVANDVMAGQVGADTAANVAQMVPIYKQLKGLSAAATKVGDVVRGSDPWVLNMPATIKKNMAITAGQAVGHPANAFADGGMVRFAGKGGPRDDQIPVKVAGAEIRVSDGEQAVILPAKTANNPGAVQAIGQIIQQSNDGRAPDMGIEDGGKYARGAVPDEEELRRTGSPIGSPLTIFGGPRPITAQEMYGSGPKAAVTAPPATVGGDMTASGRHGNAVEGGSITAVVPALQGIHSFAKPAYDLSPSMRAIQTTGAAIGNVFADSAAAQRQGMTYGDVRAARIASESATTANTAQPQQPQPAIGNEGRGSAITSINAGPRPAAPSAQPQDSGATTRNGIVQTNMGRGFDPTKLQMAPGYGMASNAAGKTLSVAPSQYVAADGSQTSRWEDTQQFKDAIARNEADKIRLAEMQSRRLGADPMAIQAARQGIASAVLGNQAKQAEMQRNEYIQSLVAKAAAETDPAKQRSAVEAVLAAQGKSGRQAKNIHVVDLGEDTVTDQMGTVKTVKRGQAIYDADTGRVVPIGKLGGATQQSFASQAEAEAAQKAGKIKVGDVVIIGGKRFAVE